VSSFVRSTGNEAELEVLEDIAVAAPTSAIEELPEDRATVAGRVRGGNSGDNRYVSEFLESEYCFENMGSDDVVVGS
jgi:hypothetical protein